MPGLLVATNERKGTAPLEFLNLTSRRGSLKAVTDPSLERRGSAGLWAGTTEGEGSLSRRGSAKRSNELGWTKNYSPPSPSISRRPSLAASLLSRDLPHSSGTNIPGGHHRGRRPSSSSSAQSSSTIRAPGSGSPSNSGLLPFGHSSKSSASTRRSSHTPISQPSYPTTTPVNAIASTSTATSPTSSISSHLHQSPVEELNSYRFGSTSTNSSSHPPTPAALDRRSTYDSDHRRHDFPEDEPNEEDEDLAREMFKASLLKAGLTSMSITMPPSSPTNASTSYHSSSSTHTPDLVTPTIHSSASDSYRFTFPTSTFTPSHRTRNYPSPRRREESDQEDDNDEEEPPGPRTRRAVSRSNFLDARRMSSDHRKELSVDDEGSGIDDETESEESDGRSRRPSTIGSPTNGALLTFRNPFSGPTAPLDPTPIASSLNSPSIPLSSLPPPPNVFNPPSTDSSNSSTVSAVGSSVTARPPPPTEPSPLRRPSLNPWLADEDGMPAINMFTARVTTSPPRSLSDSAVPRRPSLAEEVGASLPVVGSGSASVSGHEEMEWDMDFVLGGGGQGNGVDFQTLSERAHPGTVQESFEYPTSASMQASSSGGTRSASARQAEEMGIDSFALFVQNNDPLFDKHRLAWTLNRTTSPSQTTTWTLPTTGGYTYIPSLSPGPSAANTTSGSFSNPSSASSSLSGPSSQPYPSTAPFPPSRLPNPIIRGIRPPSPAWAIKPRGKGWGIIPLQGTRAEIKFGPKGKWRLKEPAPTGSGRGSGRAMQHQKTLSRDRRSTDSKAKSTSSRQSAIIDYSQDSKSGTSLAPSKSSDVGKVAWQDEYGSGGNGLGLAAAADPFARGRVDPIPIVHPSPPPSPKGHSVPLPAHTSSNQSSSGSSAPQRSSSRPGKRDKEGSKSKLKGGWLSSLKNASAVLTGKEPTSAAMSSRTSSMSGSGSGHDDLRSPSSVERLPGGYVPPWMSGHGKEKEKESGFASRIRFKRRSISDGVRRLSKEKGLSADEDGPFSFGSRRGGGASSRGALSTDDETDDGEAREGKAWEDVPNEALAMVIPLSIPQSPASRRNHGSTSTTGTFPSIISSTSTSSEYANFGAGWSPAGSPELETAGSVDPLASPPAQPNELPPPPPVEISLLVYFVPFGDTPSPEPLQSPSLHSTTPTGPGWLFNKKVKKTPSQLFKVGREGHSNSSKHNSSTPPTSPSFPNLPHHPTRPSLHPPSSFHSGSQSPTTPTSFSSQTSSLGMHQSTFSLSSSGAPRPHFAPSLSSPQSQQSQSPFSAFRIVARAVDPSDLTFLPSWPSWESQTSDAKHAAPDMMLSEPGTNPETKAKETKDGRTDPTVVGVCHGPDLGVEFVREGWERLGFVRPIGEGEGGGYYADQVGAGAFSNVGGEGEESGEDGSRLEDVLGCLVAACVAIMGSNC